MLLAEAEKVGRRPTPRRSAPTLTSPHWARVTQTRAETRGTGEPIPHWGLTADGSSPTYPGHDLDLMYLTVPLRGDFQLDCELTSARRIARSACQYGGLALGPERRPEACWSASQFGRPLAELSLNPPLEKLGEWYPFRLVVKGGRMTAFINGRKVHDAACSAGCRPLAGSL